VFNTIFRIIALVEGISYLLLLFIAVPIKYLLANDSFVKLLGMPHGVLFIAYVLLAIIFILKKNTPLKESIIILIASLIPLGTFYVDKKFLK
jgi:integral membrane protein